MIEENVDKISTFDFLRLQRDGLRISICQSAMTRQLLFLMPDYVDMLRSLAFSRAFLIFIDDFASRAYDAGEFNYVVKGRITTTLASPRFSRPGASATSALSISMPARLRPPDKMDRHAMEPAPRDDVTGC